MRKGIIKGRGNPQIPKEQNTRLLVTTVRSTSFFKAVLKKTTAEKGSPRKVEGEGLERTSAQSCEISR